jgi:hypothetical protein
METESGGPGFDRSKRDLLGWSETFGILSSRIESLSQGPRIDHLEVGAFS